jgi:hypothetical protein
MNDKKMTRRGGHITVARPFVIVIWLAAVMCAGGLPGAEVAESLRRPAAMALSADEATLYVANRDSGTISVVDAKKLELLGEAAVGERLSDIARMDDRHFLVSDEAAHELVLVAVDGSKIEIVQRLPVSAYPVELACIGGHRVVDPVGELVDPGDRLHEIEVSLRDDADEIATLEHRQMTDPVLGHHLVRDDELLIATDRQRLRRHYVADGDGLPSTLRLGDHLALRVHAED